MNISFLEAYMNLSRIKYTNSDYNPPKSSKTCDEYKKKKARTNLPFTRLEQIRLFKSKRMHERLCNLNHFLNTIIRKITLLKFSKHIGQFVFHLHKKMLFKFGSFFTGTFVIKSLGAKIDDRHLLFYAER